MSSFTINRTRNDQTQHITNPTRRVRQSVLLFSILGLSILLSFWKLQDIPGEMWGDEVEIYKLARQVRSGQFYWTYAYGGDGPMFSYFIALLSYPFGLSFFSMKMASTLVGILSVGLMYIFAKEVGGATVGLWAAFVVGASKWNLIFSRMAQARILVVFFTVAAFIFLVKSCRKKRNTMSLFAVGSLLGFGMYTQAAFWGVPLAAGLILLIYFRRSLPKLLYVGIPFLIITVPLFTQGSSLALMLAKPTSYFGEKLIGEKGVSLQTMRGLSDNLAKNILMLHVKGDGNFRSNPPNTPQLDIVTGLFFLIGLLTAPRQRRALLFIPFFLIQIPALLDVNNPSSSPSAARTIGILPFVALIAAFGIQRFVQMLTSHSLHHTRAVKIVIGVILVSILSLNYRSVFIQYPFHLPNHNIPFGRIIAEAINELPVGTEAVLVGCCWGNWGQPEPDGIRFRLTSHRVFTYIPSEVASCASLPIQKNPLFIIVDPREAVFATRLSSCFSDRLVASAPVQHPTEGTIYLGYQVK